MKILLTGSRGQLGSCFQDRVPKSWEIMATDSDTLDITDFNAVKEVVNCYQPTAIINAAAYTAVDKAECDFERAELVNECGPKNLALAAKAIGARLVHISTDYVFDGISTQPYSESDSTNPLSVYGKTKLNGEKLVCEILPDAIIIRTAWVFSEYGNNFVKTMLQLAKSRDLLNIVSDQRGCPTYAGDIAQAIIDVLSLQASGGIYNFCGDIEVSWSEFADKIFSVACEGMVIQKSPLINQVSSDEYITLAKRPHNSSLNCSKIAKLGIESSNWELALKNIINSLNID